MSCGQCDPIFPLCPDVEDKWELIGNSFLPDAVKEFDLYPTAVLGWSFYVGMAMAQFWHEDWQLYGNMPNPYRYLRDKRGFDCLDEYVREDVLLLRGDDYDRAEKLAGDCAARTHSMLLHAHLEPGTPQAFKAFVSCLHQLYLAGMAARLHQLGYEMKKFS